MHTGQHKGFLGLTLAALLAVSQLLPAGAALAVSESPAATGVVVVPKNPDDAAAGIYVNDAWTATANNAYSFGKSTDVFVVGDWNGNGSDTLGIRRSSTFYLRDQNSDGAATYSFVFGRSTDSIFIGDWDGDGKDTLAVRRGNRFYIQNTLTGGEASTSFVYGQAGDEILVGDWDGDGKDAFAVRRGNAYHIRNTLTSGVAQSVIVYGKTTDTVLAGDWDGNGADSFAVRRGNIYHIRNSVTSGVADLKLAYGRSTDDVIVGDWNSDGSDTLGVIRRDGIVPTLVAAHDPQGRIDSVAPAASAVTVSGWTYDPDTSKSLTIQIFVDNSSTLVKASLQRADVKTAYGLAQDTVGFSKTVSATAGNHRVCVVAINEGSGTSKKLGCSTVTVSASPSPTPSPSPSATTSTPTTAPPTATPTASPTSSVDPNTTFVAGNIISDAKMFDSGTMSVAEIQAFLQTQNPSCEAGQEKCLKDYTKTTLTMTSNYCSAFQGANNESAASMIAKAAQACGVNPQVLLVTLQKEQGLISATGSVLTSVKYDQALGFGCATTGTCGPQYAGFANQLYSAASRYVEYGVRASAFTYRSGGTYSIPYNPVASCGSAPVTIANKATAALYNYTPYQPNAAALANMYGTGDECSTYGNRNFWRIFTQWFGATH